ncbi:hypothetical protein PYCC9005_002285 [Savitreella phatthalungensis]
MIGLDQGKSAVVDRVWTRVSALPGTLGRRMVACIVGSLVGLMLLTTLMSQDGGREMTRSTLRGALPSGLFGGGKEVEPVERYAYSTLLSSHLEDDSDEAIEADIFILLVRLLSYQILHNPDTRTRRGIPFVVNILPTVPDKVALLLEKEGAIVRRIEPIMPRTWQSAPADKRWSDQYAKLNWFNMTEYDKVLYLDTDMLLTKSLDGIWNETETAVRLTREALIEDTAEEGIRPDEPEPPFSYMFASVGEQYTRNRQHPEPTTMDTNLQGGFWMLRPDAELFDYAMTMLEVAGPHGDMQARFNTGFMEMGLLNYMFRSRGPMPRRVFKPGKWSCNWINDDDVKNGCAALHDKLHLSGNPGKAPLAATEKWWHLLGRWEAWLDSINGEQPHRRPKQVTG